MSATARHRHDYAVESIPLSDSDGADPDVIDALSSRKNPSPADEATLRIDYSDWLDILDERHRRIAQQLASGLNTVEVARLHGISRGRVSQLRGDLIESWDRLHEENPSPVQTDER